MKNIIIVFILPTLAFCQTWVTIASSHLKQWEGFRSEPYRCQAGRLTIGYGFTGKDIVSKAAITEAEASQILDEKVQEIGEAIGKLVGTVELTDHQLAALVSLYFNIGSGAFAKSTVLEMIQNGRLDRVPQSIAMWNKVRSPKTNKLKVSRGLISRRVSEIRLWLTN